MKRILIKSILCIGFGWLTQDYAMHIAQQNMLITFSDGQKRILDKKYVAFSKTLNEMQEYTNAFDMPNTIKPALWDQVIEPVFKTLFQVHYELDENEKWHANRIIVHDIGGIMNHFHNQYNDTKSIVDSANALDFLQIDDRILSHEVFHRICTLYLKKDVEYFSKYYVLLNPGLAKRIYENKIRKHSPDSKCLCEY